MTLSRAKGYFNVLTGTEHDQPIADIVNGVTRRVEEILGRRLVVRDDDEIVCTDANGSDRFRLPTYPATVSQVRVRASMTDEWEELEEDVEYEVDEATGTIYLVTETFPIGPRTLEVTYSSGFAEKDDILEADGCGDIVQLALDYMRFVYTRWGTGLVATASVSGAGQSVTVIPEPPKDILDGLMLRRKRRL